MQQLTCTAPGLVEWVDVAEPTIEAPTDVLVRPITVARCEIDPILTFVGPTRGPAFALGHEAVAEVVAVGHAVERHAVGDLVLPSFQVCCGACTTCRRGHTALCDEYPLLSDYGMEPLSGVEYGGMLSDLVRVPHADHMATPLPAGVSPVAAASVADNVTDGYRAVAPHLAAHPGDDVLIACHGTPSIGLYAAEAARALGASSVTVASDDDAVLAVAERLGVGTLRTDFDEKPPATIAIVVDCGTDVRGLHWAVKATRPQGVLHSVSSYVAEPMLPFPLRRLYTLGIEFHIGRAHSAALLPEVVARVAAAEDDPSRIRAELVTTQVVDWADAADRFNDPTIKLVVSRIPG